MSTLTTFIQRSFGSQRRKRNKRNPNWKKEVKLSLFADDLILHTKNPKNATRKLLELIYEFGRVVGCKINTQKSLAFLYTNNKRAGREIKETIPIYHCIKKNKTTRNKPTYRGKRPVLQKLQDADERNGR